MYHRMYFVHSLCQFDEQVFEAIRASSRGAAPRNQFDLSEAHAALSAHELELLVRYSFFDRASTALTRIKEAVEEANLMRAHLEVHSFKSMAMYIGESHTDFPFVTPQFSSLSYAILFLGAIRLVRCAQELQDAAIAGRLRSAQLVVASLERSFGHVSQPILEICQTHLLYLCTTILQHSDSDSHSHSVCQFGIWPSA